MTLEGITAAAAIIGAVGSTIAAFVGVGTWGSGLLKARRDRRQADQAEWKIRDYANAGERTIRLEYNMRRPLKMRSLRVKSPKGARIQYYQTVVEQPDNGPRRFVSLPVGQPSGFLICNKLLEGKAIDAGTISLKVYIPERPFWSRSDSTRLRIEVKAEATTAGRRQSTIIVTSDEIPWTAAQTPINA